MINFLRRRAVLIVIITLAVITVGLYARLRYVNGKLVEQATQAIRMAAARDGAVAEAERVRVLLTERSKELRAAGAAVTAKVDARLERRSEASGSAIVELSRQPNETGRSEVDDTGSDGGLRQLGGRLTLTDTHGRFEASADYSFRSRSERIQKGLRATDALTIGPVAWRIHQEFKIETIQFSQRVEGETLWQGYSVTLKEISPKTGAEIERWVVPHDQIDASYVPTNRPRQWAMFTAAGFTYFSHGYQNNADFGFYGEVGLRVKRWSGAVGLTDYSPYARLGWGRDW